MSVQSQAPNEKTSLLSKPAASGREAFLAADLEASRQYHNMKHGHQETHGEGLWFIKSMVYGGIDGIMTSFASVSTVAGASYTPAILLVLGIAHLFADGLSMALGDTLSSQAEGDVYHSERAREEWELENYPEGEVTEMIDLYEELGYSRADATSIVNIMSKNKKAFVDIMMVQELNLTEPDVAPWKNGLVTFASFLVFGSIPLLPYTFNLVPGIDMSDSTMLIVCIIATLLTLFGLGALKGHLSATSRHSWWQSGVTMVLSGSAASFLAYLVAEWVAAGLPGSYNALA